VEIRVQGFSGIRANLFDVYHSYYAWLGLAVFLLCTRRMSGVSQHLVDSEHRLLADEIADHSMGAENESINGIAAAFALLKFSRIAGYQLPQNVNLPRNHLHLEIINFTLVNPS